MSKRKRRLRIGGSVWNSDINRVKSQISIAHQACSNILRIIDKNKGIPFSAAISIYVSRIALSMMTILEAINRIEAIGEDFREEQDREEEPLDELDEIARRAIARRPYEDDSE